MRTRSAEKPNMNNGVWILVALLSVLILASGVLLYSIIGSFSDGEANVIALMPNPDGEGKTPTLKPVVGEGEEIREDDGHWECSNSVDLFLTTYTNANGEIIAESANGEKIIAPGTSHTFHFSLKNTGNISMDFTMRLEGLFSLADQGLPFEVRLRSGAIWLVGDEMTWLSPDALEGVAVTNTLTRGEYLSYTLEWRWPFEGDDEQDRLLSDLNDTLAGDRSGDTDVDFSLNIHTFATVTEGALPVNQNNWIMLTEMIDPVLLYILLGLIMAGAAGGIAWYAVAKKKGKT